MTPADVIADVRPLINDTDSSAYRYSDADLLRFVNDGIRRTAVARPDLFAEFGTVTCVADEVIQTAPTDSIRVMEVFRIVGGNAVYESNRETMDQNAPSWPADPSGPAVTWMRHPRSPNRFFIYPPAPTGQQLQLEYAALPPTYVLGDTIELNDTYRSALVDCTVFLSQSIDDEHVNSGRAKMFFDSWQQALGLGAQQRVVTDTETSGLPDNEVV